MGSNSHLSIEIQSLHSYTNSWGTFALDLPETRNYYLYTAMAGVRGDIFDAVVQPRGIPKDASPSVKYWIKRAGSDGHTHSWLYPDEFNRAIKQSNAGEDKIWKTINGILTTLQILWGNENVRLVFFFDN